MITFLFITSAFHHDVGICRVSYIYWLPIMQPTVNGCIHSVQTLKDIGQVLEVSGLPLYCILHLSYMAKTRIAFSTFAVSTTVSSVVAYDPYSSSFDTRPLVISSRARITAFHGQLLGVKIKCGPPTQQ